MGVFETRLRRGLAGIIIVITIEGCGGSTGPSSNGSTTTSVSSSDGARPPSADVVAVAVEGKAGAYRFAVTVRSDDLDCTQYADWWEVVSADGRLIHRRILGHSHVDEQPFTRSGGPVAVAADEEVLVRAHMNEAGYGGRALRGTVAGGFGEADGAGREALASEPPLPGDCAF